MKLEQIGSIDLVRDAYYLCHAPSYHFSGYVIAQATVKQLSVNNTELKQRRIVSLILDNGDAVENSDILGLKRLS